MSEQDAPRPWVELHPSLGFTSGDPVRVVTRRGQVTYPALRAFSSWLLFATQRRRQLFKLVQGSRSRRSTANATAGRARRTAASMLR